MAMPTPDMRPRVSPKPIGALVSNRDRADSGQLEALYPWADRFVLGMPLAPWQREFKWSDVQCQRFITSAWTGVPLGIYVVTAMDLRDEGAGFMGVEYMPLSNMVLDGQQRLKAVELYLEDNVAVPDADGKLTVWSGVSERDKRRFERTIFDCGEVPMASEWELRRLYDTMNFGGTAHEESERALCSDGKKWLRP